MCRIGDSQRAFKLKDEMEALGVGSREVAESAMVRGLVQRGKMEEAAFVLDCMLRGKLVPTIATFTSLMHLFCKKHKFNEALNLKDAMELHGVKLDVIAYNVIITGLCAIGETGYAIELYEEMKQRGLCPNTTSFYVLLKAVSEDNSSSKGEMLLMDMQKRGLIYEDSSTQGLQEGLVVAMKKLQSLRRRRRIPNAKSG
ncbi:hypothetical protein AgCh_038508 [Apium graveolens]